MKKQYQDVRFVKKELSLSDKKLDKIIMKMRLRHPRQNWIFIRDALNDQITIYYDTVFVDWIKNVYLKNDGYYLDLEINFFENLIHKYEIEDNKKYLEIQYKDMSIAEMKKYFNKDDHNIRMAISKLEKEQSSNLKYYKDNTLIIKADGIKWINEKYYRKGYLDYLENLQLTLENEYNE